MQHGVHDGRRLLSVHCDALLALFSTRLVSMDDGRCASRVAWDKLLVYLEDVIVYGKKPEQHLANLGKV